MGEGGLIDLIAAGTAVTTVPHVEGLGLLMATGQKSPSWEMAA
jgi:hypothetical protein